MVVNGSFVEPHLVPYSISYPRALLVLWKTGSKNKVVVVGLLKGTQSRCPLSRENNVGDYCTVCSTDDAQWRTDQSSVIPSLKTRLIFQDDDAKKNLCEE